MDNKFVVVEVARICHEANKALCINAGDFSQPCWGDAPDWQKESAIEGVKFHLKYPDATPSASHDKWAKDKVEAGWRYGEVKDAQKKTHPCLVPFNELPLSDQAKDSLFRSIVHSLREFINW